MDLKEKPILRYEDILKDSDEGSKDILRQKSQPFELPLTADDITHLHTLMAYLDESLDEEYAEKWNLRAGCGLALPQIGYLKRGFAISTIVNDKPFKVIVVNPVILSESIELTYLASGEGCLSVDREVNGYVMRHKRIMVRFQSFDLETNTLKETTLKMSGMPAIIFQHEYDHLDGILFYDHINPKTPFKPADGAKELSR